MRGRVYLIYTLRGESIRRGYASKGGARRAIARLRVAHPGVAAWWIIEGEGE